MSHPAYRGRVWQVVRRATLARDAYVCKIGLPGCSGRATQADHIVELDDGGAWHDLANLQASCRSCNVAKGNMHRRARLAHSGGGGLRSW